MWENQDKEVWRLYFWVRGGHPLEIMGIFQYFIGILTKFLGIRWPGTEKSTEWPNIFQKNRENILFSKTTYFSHFLTLK